MRRRLSDDEARLWRKVASGVTPLQPQRAHLIDPPQDSAAGLRAPPGRPRAAASPAREMRGKADGVSAVGAGDPRSDRLVARGRREIEAILDLHGMTQTQAHAALYHFLADSRLRGRACVLVITGKGAGGAGWWTPERDGRGILRRRFLDWVDAPDLRPMIARVAQASRRHGGGGAFYVFLKRRA